MNQQAKHLRAQLAILDQQLQKIENGQSGGALADSLVEVVSALPPLDMATALSTPVEELIMRMNQFTTGVANDVIETVNDMKAQMGDVERRIAEMSSRAEVLHRSVGSLPPN